MADALCDLSGTPYGFKISQILEDSANLDRRVLNIALVRRYARILPGFITTTCSTNEWLCLSNTDSKTEACYTRANHVL